MLSPTVACGVSSFDTNFPQGLASLLLKASKVSSSGFSTKIAQGMFTICTPARVFRWSSCLAGQVCCKNPVGNVSVKIEGSAWWRCCPNLVEMLLPWLLMIGSPLLLRNHLGFLWACSFFGLLVPWHQRQAKVNMRAACAQKSAAWRHCNQTPARSVWSTKSRWDPAGKTPCPTRPQRAWFAVRQWGFASFRALGKHAAPWYHDMAT